MSALVYRCFSADRTLLYVGSSKNLKARLAYHEMNALWWKALDTVTTEECADLPAARAREKQAIHDEMPRWNVVWRNPDHPDGPASCVDDVYDVHPGDCDLPPWGYVPETGDDPDEVEYYRARRDRRLAHRARLQLLRAATRSAS